MTIEIHTPDLENRLRRGIQRFHDVDEFLTRALDALEKTEPVNSVEKPRKRLIDALIHPAYAGSELNLHREKEYPSLIDL